jgi:hypothetical protein
MNTKMKLLSLALIGAFGYVGSAAAGTCPAGPTVPDGGAWSAASALGGALAITTPGLDGSSCKLDTSITTNGPGVNAFVRDNTPAAEPRYRAQFIINADATGALNSVQGVKIFGATTDTPANGVSDVVRMSLTGNLAGSQKLLGVFTACAGQPGSLCSASLPLAAGNNTVEIDWNQSAGELRVWVNNNVEASPDSTLSGDSSAWGGVDFAGLGLSAPNAGFRTAHLNQIISFDRFDSRRQTFIGF